MRRADLLLGTAALTLFPRRAPAQTLTPLRIAAAIGWTLAEGYFGREGNFFAQAGLDVTEIDLTNGGAITAALLGGSVDVRAHQRRLGVDGVRARLADHRGRAGDRGAHRLAADDGRRRPAGLAGPHAARPRRQDVVSEHAARLAASRGDQLAREGRRRSEGGELRRSSRRADGDYAQSRPR